jgi:DNA mismatch repair protein MutS
MIFQGSGSDQEVVFLYKLQPGPTESSFGLNVAKMAGIPGSVVELAAKLAQEFERKDAK